MSFFRNELPCGDNEKLRQAVFAGSVFILPATASSRRLVAAVLQCLVTELSGDDVQRAQFRLSNEELLASVGRVRDQISGSANFHRLLLGVISDLGCDVTQTAFDPVRLRAVVHEGHKIPAAAKAYSMHRDSWYANPQSQINWWIPLHDVVEQQSFGFFPECFDRAVENDSASFDYAVFAAQVGWQKSSTGKQNIVYPTAQGNNDFGVKHSITCKAGDIVIFSASQLHQTNCNESGLTRFSVDFRTVDLRDSESGQGAPNTDNRSTGSALVDYVRADKVESAGEPAPD